MPATNLAIVPILVVSSQLLARFYLQPHQTSIALLTIGLEGLGHVCCLYLSAINLRTADIESFSSECIFFLNILFIYLFFPLIPSLGHKISSKILESDPDYVEKLKEWLFPVTSGPTNWVRCYRARDHGWSSSTFHSKCNNLGPTITIVKVGAYKFGGYTDAQWRTFFH